MAGGWIKSMQCKSKVVDDVLNPYPKSILSSSSCRKSVNSIRDVVVTPPSVKRTPRSAVKPKGSVSDAKPSTVPKRSTHVRNAGPAPQRSLTELPDGHPSRNVVEIIFHSSWGCDCKPFSGQVEVIFKVHNGSRTISRFEDYRRLVKDRASISGRDEKAEEDARCAADGNEMMRFHCLGPTTTELRGGAWLTSGHQKSGSGICTYSGSGRAHENAGWCGVGRGAMLVCRVIAGRVSKPVGLHKAGFDSVGGDGGALVVFDPRAVLPCFLIIYKL